MVLITDKFHKASNGTRAEATTLTAQKALAASSISTAALNGWPTDTPVNFQLYTTDTQNNIVPGSQSDWVGIVSGTTITQLQLTGGSDDIYPIGTIVVCLPTSDWADSIVEGILVEHTQTGAHTLTSASTLTSSKFITAINDTNGNELLKLTPTASAVNEFTITNGATGNAPTLTATGGDTNIDFSISPKGTGVLKVGGNTVNTGSWVAWTPTWTNLTVGNGTVSAFYSQIGKTITCNIAFQMGSTSSMGSNPTLSLPVTGAARYATSPLQPIVGNNYIEDFGVTGYYGVIQIGSTTVAKLTILGTASTYGQYSGLSATVPFTWGTSDYFVGAFSYEAA